MLKGLSLGAGSVLLSPMIRRLVANAEGKTRPPRFVFVLQSNGFDAVQACPKSIPFQKYADREKFESIDLAQHKLSKGLAPLEELKSRTTIVQGLSGRCTGGGHSTHGGCLGMYRTSPASRSPQNITIDYQLGQAIPDDRILCIGDGILTDVAGAMGEEIDSLFFDAKGNLVESHMGEISAAQRDGLSQWLVGGKGYVGIHSAADSFRDDPDYRNLVGGHFITHPRYRQYQVSVKDPEHPIMAGIDEEFTVEDEQYILDYDPLVHVLANALYKGDIMPVAWTKSHGEGRVFYQALGHDPKACEHPMFKQMLVQGTLWAAGAE